MTKPDMSKPDTPGMIDVLDELRELLPPYLSRQRWFAGAAPDDVKIVDCEDLGPRLWWVLIEAGAARYQLLVGRAGGLVPEFLHGEEAQVLGSIHGEVVYDALLDPELVRIVVAQIAPDEEISRVRPMGAEQSNTSLVLDDRLVLKVFRRIHEGPNPDIEVTGALAAAGFEHVAAPIGAWESAGAHLAVLQPYLGGGIDGWALALTSLRDFFGSECDTPQECGGDFAAEASRLGEMTGRMHVALAGALGTEPADVDGWLQVMERQLARIGEGRPWQAAARRVLRRIGEQEEAGVAIRVHGDYHLGQALRTDTGWYVLDFEGEPARPLEERRLPSSPLKDVAGILRSFHYATAVALRERPEAEWEARQMPALAWEQRNRNAFLAGYLATGGISELLPATLRDTITALVAWELDKAVYEVGYERDHRPDWVDIPESAIARLLSTHTG